MKKLGVALMAVALATFVVAAPPDWADTITERIPGRFLGLLAWQWICLLGITVLGVLLHWTVRIVARRIFRLRESLTGKKAETGERTLRRGVGILGFVLPWYLFLDIAGLSADADSRIRLIVQALTILGVVLAAYGVWDTVCDAIGHRASGVAHAERLLIPVTRKLVRFVILLAGLLAALGVFGVNITGLLAGVGLGGLVVALAAKDSVENVFGSLTILFDMPFSIGDWVKIDKYEGIIEEINLRSTRIRTFEDSIITLPNSNLIKAAVENYGARRYRRQRFLVRVSYANNAANLARFIELIRGYLGKVPAVVPDRTIVEVYEMTELSVGVLVQCFFEAATFGEEAGLRNNLMLAIFKAQEQSGVIFIGTPIPPPPEKPHRLSKEMEKLIIDKEDII
ncbi:MAG TPA: mechanosensitive ion channel domain-containing protein [Fimbriimonadaceae bacterium]|nr:mechanosensitive ion channel domain-containing protein [Fimbriimonadaceae bacterium]